MVDEIMQLASTISEATKNISELERSDVDALMSGLMTDPAYLRQSSALINEALQKGFDVLQLPNGDIVTTGTKTIVYQYHWDEEAKKMNVIDVTESMTEKMAAKAESAE